MLLKFFRDLPRPAQVAAGVVPAGLLLGALVVAGPLNLRGRTAVKPSPSACATIACVTPSPPPEPSPSASPEPSPSPTAPPPPPPRPPPPPPPPPAAVSCAAPGGSPAGNIPANFPVALAFAPDGRLFWDERAGTIKVWQGGAARVFAPMATTQSGERGLLGLALPPSFASNHFVYAMYSEPDGAHQTIMRWTDCGGGGTNPTVIVSGLPGGTTCCHKGGRIAFGPDGFLYATLGDLHSAPNLNAQDPCDPRGKVLRYTPRGAPAGVGCGATWVSGLRNSFGLAFAPDGTLALTNNGPSGDAGTPCGSCGDEFYLVGQC